MAKRSTLSKVDLTSVLGNVNVRTIDMGSSGQRFYGTNARGRSTLLGKQEVIDRLMDAVPEGKVNADLAANIIHQLQSGTRIEKVNVNQRSANVGFVQIRYSANFSKVLTDGLNRGIRMQVAQRQLDYKVIADDANISAFLAALVAKAKQMVHDLMMERVYNNPAKVSYYTSRTSAKTVFGEVNRAKWPDYTRSERLLTMMVEGIKLVGNRIEVGFDSSLAPYYLWVDRGHRVVVPTGKKLKETGTFVMPRPFLEDVLAIYEAVMQTNVLPAMKRAGVGIAEAVARWVVDGGGTVSGYKEAFVSDFPGVQATPLKRLGGANYTGAFFRHVGATR